MITHSTSTSFCQMLIYPLIILSEEPFFFTFFLSVLDVLHFLFMIQYYGFLSKDEDAILITTETLALMKQKEVTIFFP